MDLLDSVTDESLISFLHIKKTEMSCIENPNIFLNQLRDHHLVPEDLYKKVIKMRNKDRKREGVYKILDWVEKERGQCVKTFWSCVFRDHIQKEYSVFRWLRNSLLDGSYQNDEKLLSVEKPGRSKEVEREEKEKEQNKGARKRKKSGEEKDEENSASSSASNQEKQPRCSRLLQRGELPVTCGDKKGTLYPDKLARGGRCILAQDRWFTPLEFERFAGKGSSKNWKLSIRYKNIQLLKLIKVGQLQCPRTYRRTGRKVQEKACSSSRVKSSSSQLASRVETDKRGRVKEEEEEEEDSETVDLSEFQAYDLPVTCGSLSGILYKNRFKGGSCGDDKCYICNTAGNLVFCDDCPRAFHRRCHLPVLHKDKLGDNWICTYCVLKINHRLWIHMSREGAMRSPVSGNMMRCEYLLLRLYKADTQRVFTDDPREGVARYSRVISNPMWLNRVKNKLQNNGYKKVGQFVHDIKLIFNNYQTFNRGNTCGTMEPEMNKMFMKEFDTIFKIQ